ncbi:MAG TPA: transporter substrate-binding domain-containing protein [Burkholderiaceae bacterium]
MLALAETVGNIVERSRRLALLAALWLPCLAAAAEHLTLLTEEYPPFNMSDGNGGATGVSSDIVKVLMKEAQIGYSIALVPWQRAVIQAHTVPGTCVFSMSRTPEREPNYRWIGPLVANDWALFAKSGGKTPKDIAEVKNASIGSYAGDAIVAYLQTRGYRVDIAQNDDLNPNKLLAGHIDYWATGKLIGQYRLKRQNIPGIEPVLVFNRTEMYLACHPGTSPELVERLNRLLGEMNRRGEIERIYARFGYSR